MEWVLEPDAKPQNWKLVIVRCTIGTGEAFEADGFWTGQDWRIVGRKRGLEDLTVIRWRYRFERGD